MNSVVEYKENKVTYVPLGNKDQIELSINLVSQFVANPTKSGKMPGKKDIVNFIMMCQAKKLNPFEGDAYLIGFDGQNGPEFSLITAHQAFLKRAEISKEFEGMESGIILLGDDNKIIEREGDFMLDDEKLVGAWARVHRSDRKIPTYRRVKLSTFDKGRSRWKTDPAGMIVKCAEADALRSTFPTLLGGLYIENEMPSADEMPPAMSLEEKINNREIKNVSTDTRGTASRAERSVESDTAKSAEGGGHEADKRPDAATKKEEQEKEKDRPTPETEEPEKAEPSEEEPDAPGPPVQWPIKIRQAYANAGIVRVPEQNAMAGDIGIVDIRKAGKSAFEAVIKQLAKLEKAGRSDPLDVSEEEVDEIIRDPYTKDLFDDNGVRLDTPLKDALDDDKAARKIKYIREKFREAADAMKADGIKSIVDLCEMYGIPGLTTEYVTVGTYNRMVDQIKAAKAAHS